MVAAVRRGRPLREVARKFRVALRTVQVRVARAAGQRLDRVDWSDRPRGGRRAAAATDPGTEDLVVRARRGLRDASPLGEPGAAAVRRELDALGVRPLPSVRTIGRILLRRGALDGRRRTRRPPPPKGWYLPAVAGGRAEPDSFDFVEGLVIRGGIDVKVLNTVGLLGGLCGSYVRSSWTAKDTVAAMAGHWRENGLPGYAQFDNDTIFRGNHRWPDSFGRVTRLCLQLGLVPVFAPPREVGFRAAVENYNGRWQAAVWRRSRHDSLEALSGRSDRFVAAARARSAARRDAAPARSAFPAGWSLDLGRPLRGGVVFLRRTNDRGEADLLGRRYPVDANWPHRLVRAEVDLTAGRIGFYRPRRREPGEQPLAREVPYRPPTKRFQE